MVLPANSAFKGRCSNCCRGKGHAVASCSRQDYDRSSGRDELGWRENSIKPLELVLVWLTLGLDRTDSRFRSSLYSVCSQNVVGFFRMHIQHVMWDMKSDRNSDK